MIGKKAKYIIDPISLTLKQVERSGRNITRKLLSGLGISMIAGLGIAVAFFQFVESPKENGIDREIKNYKLQMQMLEKKADKAIGVLNVLQEKDDRTYRAIFSMTSLGNEMRNPGIGGADHTETFIDENSHNVSINNVVEKINLITRKIAVQKNSYKDLSIVIAKKEKMLLSVPSIMPIDRNKIRMSSGFGWRRNPFTRANSQFHPGIDFAGRVGTPIYATGDGVVVDPNSGMTGYGIAIIVDHGFGFKTLYAHLSKKIVKYGDVVKRGQVIGYLGNTGPSTGPHLHYEVIRDGQKVNPINYIYSGFSNEEYQQLIKEAEESSDILS